MLTNSTEETFTGLDERDSIWLFSVLPYFDSQCSHS